jgi:hypothetical protein
LLFPQTTDFLISSISIRKKISPLNMKILSIGILVCTAIPLLALEVGNIKSVNAQTFGEGSPLTSGLNRRCMDADLNNPRDGAQIQLWDCNGEDQQKWIITGDEQGFLTIRSGLNGKCLDADVNNGANGTKVQLWRCNGSLQQRWSGSGNTITSAAFPTKCLDADANMRRKNGARVQMWVCNKTPQQQWFRN